MADPKYDSAAPTDDPSMSHGDSRPQHATEAHQPVTMPQNNDSNHMPAGAPVCAIGCNEPLSLRVARTYLGGLHSLRYPLLMTYMVIVIGLAFAAAEFPSDVQTAVSPPTDSQAYHADEMYKTHFPMLQTADTSFLIARPTSQPIEFALDLRYINFDAMLNYWCNTGRDPPKLIGFTIPNASWIVSSYSSYRSVTDLGLFGPVADAYLGNGGYATYAQVSYDKVYQGNGSHPSASEFIKQINDKIDYYLELNGLGGLVEVTPLGVAAFMNDINASTVTDIVMLFGIFTPLALIVFGFTLGSARIVLLPLVSLVATSVLTFAFMHFVAMNIAVNSLAPGVAASVCLVLSFSFSYSIAAKFQRETLDQLSFGGDRQMVVLELVLAYSGRTVFVSGTCISLCTLGLVFFPIEMLRSIGLSCLFAALSAMFVNLTVLPTLLLCAPDFFARGLEACIWPIFFDGTHPHEMHHHDHDPSNPHGMSSTPIGSQPALSGPDDGPSVLRRTPRVALSQPPGHPIAAAHRGAAGALSEEDASRIGSLDAATRASHRVQRVRFFYKHFIAFLVQMPVSIACILVVLALCGYPMSQAFSTKYSNDLTQFVPRDSSLLPAWDFMQRTFRAGEVFQYSLVMRFNFVHKNPFVPDANYTMLLNNQTFVQGQRAITMLVDQLPHTTGHAFDTFFWNGLENKPMLRQFYINCSTNQTTATPEQQKWFIDNMQGCILHGIYFAIFLNPGVDGYFTWVQTRLSFNPLSSEGVDWYHKFLEIVPEIERETGISMWLSGYPADTIDLVRFAQEKFPVVVVIVVMILFVSACFLCLSLGVPLRGLLIVFVTTATCFGLGNLIFCHGMFSWLPLVGLQGREGAVAWLMPFAVLLLVVGIAVHYDLSIVLRVKQFHHHGHSTTASIILAAQETGSEITVSAAMTMLLFTGLVFSKVPAMNQLGFYLLLAALLQGIIFRLFLSTTLMAVLSEWNWFPLNVIAPTPVVPLAEDPLLYDTDANFNNASFNPDMMVPPMASRDYRNASASASQGPPAPGAEDRRSQQAPAPGQQGSDRTGLLLAQQQQQQQQQQQPAAQGSSTPRGPSASQPNSARGRTQHYGSIEVEAM